MLLWILIKLEKYAILVNAYALTLDSTDAAKGKFSSYLLDLLNQILNQDFFSVEILLSLFDQITFLGQI